MWVYTLQEEMQIQFHIGAEYKLREREQKEEEKAFQKPSAMAKLPEIIKCTAV